jgi:HTH-type transcriptional regulator/antitoxin HigA
MTDTHDFAPDWVSPPGDSIADRLEELGWEQADLATRTGFTRKHVNELVRGKKPISAEAAERLARVLGSTAEFWLTREAQHRAGMERRRALDACKDDVGWLGELPVAWMKRRGILPTTGSKPLLVDRALRWFGVASVDAWRQAYAGPLAAFRASNRLHRRLGAVAVWLRCAEQAADRLVCRPFDRDGLMTSLAQLRAWTAEPDPSEFLPKLQALLAAHGVALVVEPSPPGCPVHGATRWLTKDRALLALSMRYRSNDQLWFSLFHELGHLLKHGRKLFFVEGMDGLDAEHEGEADRFAAEVLISSDEADALHLLGSERDIRRTAERLGVAPGIVVGRMQQEGWIPRSHFNGLKVRYDWAGSNE